jgi:hypothetical protein
MRAIQHSFWILPVLCVTTAAMSQDRLSIQSAGQGLFHRHLADYDAELRLPRGRVDTFAMVKRLEQLGVTSPAKTAQGRFHIPFISMTAANADEFRLRHGNPATPDRIAKQLRISLQAWRDGKCDGVVTYCLDKRPESPTFSSVQRLFQQVSGEASGTRSR